MNAIKKVRRYMERHPGAAESVVLARLAASLNDEREFRLKDLYELDLEAFDLAVELMNDWRLDRYYAAQMNLLDAIVGDAQPGRGGEPRVSEPAPTH
jgi:hypothetical protein